MRLRKRSVSVIANSPRRDPRRAKARCSVHLLPRMRRPSCFLREGRTGELQGTTMQCAGMDTSYDDEWIRKSCVCYMPTIRCNRTDDQRHIALEKRRVTDDWPQTKQARPSVKAARIDEPERAWFGSARFDRTGACRNLRHSGHRGTRHGDDDCAPRALSALRQGAGVIPAGRSLPGQCGEASSRAQQVIGCCASPHCCGSSPGRHCGGQ